MSGQLFDGYRRVAGFTLSAVACQRVGAAAAAGVVL